jgi:hypothetical protein
MLFGAEMQRCTNAMQWEINAIVVREAVRDLVEAPGCHRAIFTFLMACRRVSLLQDKLIGVVHVPGLWSWIII